MAQDEDGNWVYRNAATGQVQDRPPPGWQPVTSLAPGGATAAVGFCNSSMLTHPARGVAVQEPNHPWVRARNPDGSWSYCNVTTGETRSAPPDGWTETNPNHPWVRGQNAAGEWVYSNVETGTASGAAPDGWFDVLPLTKKEQAELMGYAPRGTKEPKRWHTGWV